MVNSSPHASLGFRLSRPFFIIVTFSNVKINFLLEPHIQPGEIIYHVKQFALYWEVKRLLVDPEDQHYLFFFQLPKELLPRALQRQQVRYLSWNEARRNNKGAICLSDPATSTQKVWASKEGQHKCWWVIICLEGVSQQMSVSWFKSEANGPYHHPAKKEKKHQQPHCWSCYISN